ncbi:MAG: hypothetical protein QMD36_00005, partial [Candidatus Aenigmarchaeota archaeon]|nr:hypothetical protein [Candidatus Aenigmarchaeota archaeon]
GDYKIICNLRETRIGIDPLIDSKNVIVSYSPVATTTTTVITTTRATTTTTRITTTTTSITTTMIRITTTRITTTTIPESCEGMGGIGCFMGSGGCSVACKSMGYGFGICEFWPPTVGDCEPGCCCYCTGKLTTTTKVTTTIKATTTTSGGGGGDGCPILKVYDGKDFTTKEKLNIHAPAGKDTTYTSKFSMQPKDGRYEIILDEAAYLYWDGSYIDYVKLTDENGNECRLVSAIHSKHGDVLSLIAKSDDTRVRTFPGEEIKLVYKDCSGNSFTFMIEGYNRVFPVIKSIVNFFKGIFGIE